MPYFVMCKGDAARELADLARFRQCDYWPWQRRQCFRADSVGSLQGKHAVTFAKCPNQAEQQAHAIGKIAQKCLGEVIDQDRILL